MTDMDWYSVTIEYRASDGAAEQVTDDQIDEFMTHVEPHDGVISGGAGYQSYDATVGVTSFDAFDAEMTARNLVEFAREKAGLPAWPIARVEVVREDVQDEELARPTLPDLVSGPEAAEILEVSTQRLHQLAADHRDFPAPVYELRAGKLWLRSAIEAFAERWNRKPGRPRKDVA